MNVPVLSQKFEISLREELCKSNIKLTYDNVLEFARSSPSIASGDYNDAMDKASLFVEGVVDTICTCERGGVIDENICCVIGDCEVIDN